MRRPLLLLLAALVLVPSGFALVLGSRAETERRASLSHQFVLLLEDALAERARGIAGTRAALERHAIARLDAAPPTPEGLRDLRRSEPLFAEVFLVDAMGALVFPAPGGTEGESEFLERTGAIWKREAILYSPRSDEAIARGGSAKASSFTHEPRGGGDSILRLAGTEGWIAWHWTEGVHFLFWRRRGDGWIIGAEIDRVVLLSRIIQDLPEHSREGRIVLADPKGDPLYQWGPFDPTGAPTARVVLEHPLDAWRLEYHASPAQRAAFLGANASVGLYAGLVAMLGVLSLAAVYLYREVTRDLRDAGRRVDFVTQVSHELKTPLANIRLYAEILEDRLGDDPELAKRTGVIVAESQRLTRLINNILTFAKQEKSELRLERRPVAIDPLIRRVLEHFGPALAAKGIEPTFAPGAPRPAVADPDAVEQILANLVGNVEKYAAGGGRLIVASVQTDRETRIVVEDRGPGVPRAQRERIFEPFYRLSDRLSDGVTGTGIGLTIARKLARENGGDLELEDAAVGSRFVLSMETGGSE